MVNDNTTDTVHEITRIFSQLFWEWDLYFWNDLVTSLQLLEKERVGGRVTYLFADHQEISAYFDNQECLRRIEIPIAVYWETEFLEGEKYERILNFFLPSINKWLIRRFLL